MSVTSAPAETTPATLSDVKPFGVRFRLKGVPWIPLVILALVLIGAAGGEDLAPQDPNGLNLGAAFRPPFWQANGSLEHILGTDNLGRDVLSKIIVGARVSVIVSFYAIIFSGAIGTLLTMPIAGGSCVGPAGLYSRCCSCSHSGSRSRCAVRSSSSAPGWWAGSVVSCCVHCRGASSTSGAP